MDGSLDEIKQLLDAGVDIDLGCGKYIWTDASNEKKEETDLNLTPIARYLL